MVLAVAWNGMPVAAWPIARLWNRRPVGATEESTEAAIVV
jgi:hypothetical protein